MGQHFETKPGSGVPANGTERGMRVRSEGGMTDASGTKSRTPGWLCFWRGIRLSAEEENGGGGRGWGGTVGRGGCRSTSPPRPAPRSRNARGADRTHEHVRSPVFIFLSFFLSFFLFLPFSSYRRSQPRQNSMSALSSFGPITLHAPIAHHTSHIALALTRRLTDTIKANAINQSV